MYRVTKLSGTFYAKEFNDLRRELPEIDGLLGSGDHVLLVNDLSDAARLLDIEESEIVVVDDE